MKESFSAVAPSAWTAVSREEPPTASVASAEEPTESTIPPEKGLSESSKIGVGLVGGVGGLALLVGLVWWIRRNRRREQLSHDRQAMWSPSLNTGGSYHPGESTAVRDPKEIASSHHTGETRSQKLR